MDGVEGLFGVYVFVVIFRLDFIDFVFLWLGWLDKLLFCDMLFLEDCYDILKVLLYKVWFFEELVEFDDVLLEVVWCMDGFLGVDI